MLAMVDIFKNGSMKCNGHTIEHIGVCGGVGLTYVHTYKFITTIETLNPAFTIEVSLQSLLPSGPRLYMHGKVQGARLLSRVVKAVTCPARKTSCTLGSLLTGKGLLARVAKSCYHF